MLGITKSCSNVCHVLNPKYQYFFVTKKAQLKRYMENNFIESYKLEAEVMLHYILYLLFKILTYFMKYFV